MQILLSEGSQYNLTILPYFCPHLFIFPLPEKKDNKCGHIVMGATSQMRIHLKILVKIIIAYIYSTKAL